MYQLIRTDKITSMRNDPIKPRLINCSHGTVSGSRRRKRTSLYITTAFWISTVPSVAGVGCHGSADDNSSHPPSQTNQFHHPSRKNQCPISTVISVWIGLSEVSACSPKCKTCVEKKRQTKTDEPERRKKNKKTKHHPRIKTQKWDHLVDCSLRCGLLSCRRKHQRRIDRLTL